MSATPGPALCPKVGEPPLARLPSTARGVSCNLGRNRSVSNEDTQLEASSGSQWAAFFETARVLRKHMGRYETPEGPLTIAVAEGKLYATVRNRKQELRAKSELEFYALDSDREYTFKRNAGGATTAVVVHFPERAVESPRAR